jgi:hypothetical protein
VGWPLRNAPSTWVVAEGVKEIVFGVQALVSVDLIVQGSSGAGGS